jgi:DNA-binding response OmpR family regulator
VSSLDPCSATCDYAEDPRDSSILFVEFDGSLASELVEQLRADRFRAVHARTAEHARTLARSQTVRAIVLGQLELPHGALDLLEEVRHGDAGPTHRLVWDERLPAIVLGPVDGELELLRAFEAGADDFIAPPISYLELRARLKALLRRAESHASAHPLCIGLLEIDTAAHAVRFAGAPVDLCRLEYELLVHLARQPTAVCPKQDLLRAIWKQRTSSSARTVDSHASRLRRKLDAAGASGFVVNVWGVGYRLI